MIKIMLVEDDKSLREIYGVRLLAEGYDIVSAGDGEEALAMAIKERPALIVTDVMMPRISGFDMLDILRSTTETKNIKVIMMTALSSEDQRKHGEQLGADRYLVKSQVGIEDVVRVVHEVLGDGPVSPPPAAAAPVQAAAPPAAPQPPAAPVTAPAQQTTPVVPASRPASPGIPAPPSPPLPTPAAPGVPPQVADPMVKIPAPVAKPPQPVQSTAPVSAGSRQRVIQPLNDPASKIDINNLLDKEIAREAGVDVNNRPAIATTQQERAVMADQLRNVAPGAQVAAVPAPAAMQQPPVVPPAQPAAAPPRPPVQAPPRPNTAPLQPRPGGAPPAPGV